MVSRRILLAAVAVTVLVGGSGSGQELAVATPDAALTSRCGDGGLEVARLPQGQRVQLRFALVGADTRCYSVSTDINGLTLSGYLQRESLSGLENFEQARREASSQQLVREAIQLLSTPPTGNPTADTVEQRYGGGMPAALLAAAEALNKGRPEEANRLLSESGLPAENRDAAVVRCRALLQLTRPAEAKRVIAPALRNHPEDPELLALAGLVAVQTDDLRDARNYLRKANKISPNASIERILKEIEREEASDEARHTAIGSRFTLRYEGEALPPAAAGQLKVEFEREINRITYELGLNSDERLAIIVQSQENYRNATGAADWSGGKYDGRIHISVPPDGRVDEHVRRAFSHEFVHACMARAGRWPTWLHEGLAQKLSGESTTPQNREALKALAEQQALPALAGLDGSWARLDGRQATVAYALSLHAVETFYREFQVMGLRNLLKNPSHISQITNELDTRIQAQFR